jgi:hypothetical protein
MREDCKNYGSSFCADFECSKCPALEFKGTVVEKSSDIETELVKQYMAHCGWQMPSLNDKHADFSDYDSALETVKWFMAKIEEAGYIQPLKPADSDELNRLIELVITQNAPPGSPVNPLYWSKVTRKLFAILKEYRFVQIRKGDLYFSKEQLSQRDPAEGLYNEG